MNLNDLTLLMKQEHLMLAWLMQSVPTFWEPNGRFKLPWAACVHTVEKVKGERGPRYGWGYGITPEEAILAAIDGTRKAPTVYTPRGEPAPARPRIADFNLEDLDI